MEVTTEATNHHPLLPLRGEREGTKRETIYVINPNNLNHEERKLEDGNTVADKHPYRTRHDTWSHELHIMNVESEEGGARSEEGGKV